MPKQILLHKGNSLVFIMFMKFITDVNNLSINQKFCRMIKYSQTLDVNHSYRTESFRQYDSRIRNWRYINKFCDTWVIPDVISRWFKPHKTTASSLSNDKLRRQLTINTRVIYDYRGSFTSYIVGSLCSFSFELLYMKTFKVYSSKWIFGGV